MADWKDNKYGMEAGYSALNEAESFGWVAKAVLGILAVAALAAGLLWWLLAA